MKTGDRGAKKPLFILLLIIVISSICSGIHRESFVGRVSLGATRLKWSRIFSTAVRILNKGIGHVWDYYVSAEIIPTNVWKRPAAVRLSSGRIATKASGPFLKKGWTVSRCRKHPRRSISSMKTSGGDTILTKPINPRRTHVNITDTR